MNIIYIIIGIWVGVQLSHITPVFEITMMQGLGLGLLGGVVGFICILIYAGIKR